MIAVATGSFPWSGTTVARALERALREADGAAPVGGEGLRALQDRATREVIEIQERAGLERITDGMVRWPDPISAVVAPMRGARAGPDRVPYPAGGVPCPRPVVEGELEWQGPIVTEDYLFAHQGARRPVSPILPGPFTLATLADDQVYGETMVLAMGFAAVLNQELRSLTLAGARAVQIDEPALLLRKEDFPTFTRIWEVLGRGVGASLGLHLEGGDLDGIYPGVARLKRLGWLGIDIVSGRATLDLLARSPWPEGPGLCLGVVDGRDPGIEPVEGIVAMIRGAAGLPPSDRLQLGAASGLGGLPSEAAEAKSGVLARAARILASA